MKSGQQEPTVSRLVSDFILDAPELSYRVGGELIPLALSSSSVLITIIIHSDPNHYQRGSLWKGFPREFNNMLGAAQSKAKPFV